MSGAPRHPLAGTAVVVTGAASGIGRALAVRLSRQGCPVALADVDEVGLAATASSVAGPVLTRAVDVSDDAAVRRFADDVRGWLPAPLGAVVNNAGVALVASVVDGDPRDADWLHGINFGGVVNGTRAFLPVLRDQGHGAVVNLSSVFGLLAMPYQSAYCAAKFAVRGFTEALRHELRGTGVRAVTVHPGGIRTNIARNGRLSGVARDLGTDPARYAAEFEAMALTTPERAAKIIVRGVERGRNRILVGPDAYLFDALARLTPGHYDDLIAFGEPRIRRASRLRLRLKR